MVLGLLLARAGVAVTVLEKHADFLRDFRGDTIHPSTLQLMFELGILEEFLLRPHQELTSIGAQIEQFSVTVADFSHLPTRCKFIALMPQWDFLNFICEKARAYPHFQLLLESAATDLILENNRVAGVRAKNKDEEFEIRADLTFGADGRHSVTREKAQLHIDDLGAPIDVLWLRLSRQPTDPEQALGRFHAGKILVMLNRAEYWQCAFVISKSSFAAIQQNGLPAFSEDLATIAPFLRDRTQELQQWSDIKLLSVSVDRLEKWSRPGLLCIGDAAHAMSPIGGVGINLAIQDAVATANILAATLATSAPPAQLDTLLHKIQARREFAVKLTQSAQVFAHKRFIAPALATKEPIRALPFPLKLLRVFPILRRVPARLVGLGVRPEHVHSPDASRRSL